MIKMERITSSRPTAKEALSAVYHGAVPDDLQPSHITIHVLESGHVTWRVHPFDGGEYVGGVETAQT